MSRGDVEMAGQLIDVQLALDLFVQFSRLMRGDLNGACCDQNTVVCSFRLVLFVVKPEKCW